MRRLALVTSLALLGCTSNPATDGGVDAAPSCDGTIRLGCPCTTADLDGAAWACVETFSNAVACTGGVWTSFTAHPCDLVDAAAGDANAADASGP
jgi:hypothetical protein